MVQPQHSLSRLLSVCSKQEIAKWELQYQDLSEKAQVFVISWWNKAGKRLLVEPSESFLTKLFAKNKVSDVVNKLYLNEHGRKLSNYHDLMQVRDRLHSPHADNPQSIVLFDATCRKLHPTAFIANDNKLTFLMPQKAVDNLFTFGRQFS